MSAIDEKHASTRSLLGSGAGAMVGIATGLLASLLWILLLGWCAGWLGARVIEWVQQALG
jgi:type IV secretory pathway TrbD component